MSGIAAPAPLATFVAICFEGAMRLSMRVWDLPIRLFHAAIPVLYVIDVTATCSHHVHLQARAVEIMLTLVLWRLAWGVVGSDTARLRAFRGSPVPCRQPDNRFGHDAAGGWLVLVMLGLLLVQAGGGTLHALVPQASLPWQRIHLIAMAAVAGAIALHLLILLIHARLNGQALRAIFTGKQRMPAAMRAPRMASPGLAALVLLCAGGGVALLIGALSP